MSAEVLTTWSRRWILYSEPVYNLYNNFSGSVWWSWGIASFQQVDESFYGQASSLKYAGPATGYKSSSLSLYQAEKFAGGQVCTYQDTPELLSDQLHAQSAILTGFDDWTIFEWVLDIQQVCSL